MTDAMAWDLDTAARQLAQLPPRSPEYARERQKICGRLGADPGALDLMAENFRQCSPGPAPNGWDEGAEMGFPSGGPTDNASAPIPPMDWRELAEGDPPQRSWHIRHWLTTGPTLFAGLPGTGKTQLIQQIATHKAMSRCYLTNTQLDRPRRVLMWACEDDRDELWRRQIAICDHYGLPMEKLDDFHLVPRLGADNVLLAKIMGKAAWTATWRELREQVNDTEADILVLDNLTQVCAELNDPHMAVLFVNACAGLRSDLAVILVGHPSKAINSEYGGTMQWESACRMRWYFGAKLPDSDDEGEPDDDVRYLAKRKSNYSRLDYIRFRNHNGLLIPDSQDGPRFDAKAKAERAEAAIRSALPKLIEMGACPTNSSNSPGYLPRLMGEYKLSCGFTKKELHSAMVDLLNSGDIKRGTVGQYANRTPKMGLVLTA